MNYLIMAALWAEAEIHQLRLYIMNEMVDYRGVLTAEGNRTLTFADKVIDVIKAEDTKWWNNEPRSWEAFDSVCQDIINVYLSWVDTYSHPNAAQTTGCMHFCISDMNDDTGAIYRAYCELQLPRFWEKGGCAKCPQKYLIDTEEREIEEMPAASMSAYCRDYARGDLPF